MSLRALKQYIELYHFVGIGDFFIESKEFKVDFKKDDPKQNGIDQIQTTGRSEANTTDFALLKRKYANCQNCSFSSSRMKFVYGEGRQDADCLVIGNPPITDENVAGRPFVGQFGVLFDKMMDAIKLKRNNLYLTNITKCKPLSVVSEQYQIDLNEIKKCLTYLYEQIDIIKPKIILVFGEIAANALFEKKERIEYFRENQGQLFRGIPVYVTYNPLNLLQNIELKKLAWVDLQLFRDAYLNVTQASTSNLPPHSWGGAGGGL